MIVVTLGNGLQGLFPDQDQAEAWIQKMLALYRLKIHPVKIWGKEEKK